MKKNLIIGLMLWLVAFSGASFAKANTGLLFNVTTSGFTLTINTTIPNRTYPKAGIKIRTSGYSLRNAGTECTLNANGYCIFPVSNTTSRAITLSGPSSGTVDIILCLNGVGPLSCQNYNVAVTALPRFAFVTNVVNGVNDRVSSCPINLNGTFGACTDSGNTGNPFGDPIGIVINSAGTMAYVANASPNSINICPVNTNGTLGPCVNSGNSITNPNGVAINPAGTILYVTSTAASDDVLMCPINPNGLLGTCVTTGNSGVGFNNPFTVTINKAGTIAYVGNNGNSTVSLCPINLNGTFGACVDSGNTGLAFSNPLQIVLNNANTLAWVTNLGANAVYLCPINPNGTFGACASAGNSGVPFNSPTAMTVNSTETLAYVSNAPFPLYQILICPINSNGTLGACADSGNTGLPFFLPRGIAILYQ